MDANVMDTEKKVYNTPELVEHGSLLEVTQYNCDDDAFDPMVGGFGSWDNCQ